MILIASDQNFNLVRPRVAKCHGYDGYIRVKLLASWGKSLGEHTILQNEDFFGGDLHNLCGMSLSKLSNLTESSTSVLQKCPLCQFWCQNGRDLRASLRVKFGLKVLLHVKRLTFSFYTITPQICAIF